MNIIKNILRQFENHEQAKIEIDYCAIDKEYTVILEQNGIRSGFMDDDLEKVFIRVADNVAKLKGSFK